MDQEELERIVRELTEAGARPQLCDTRIPFDENPVRAGIPSELGNLPVEEGIYVPRNLLSSCPTIAISVRGDSMVDIGIDDGDRAVISLEKMPRSGDVVVAMLGREFTVKSFFEDDDGSHWLVPNNAEKTDVYKPIRLDDTDDVRIFGVVEQVIKVQPRTSNRKMRQQVAAARRASAVVVDIPPQRVSFMIRTLGAEIQVARLWFSVYRAMVDKSLIAEQDYEGFCVRIAEELPTHQHLPQSVEMSRMAVGSFAKPVVNWVESNAPVKGKRFKLYKKTAERGIAILTTGED